MRIGAVAAVTPVAVGAPPVARTIASHGCSVFPESRVSGRATQLRTERHGLFLTFSLASGVETFVRRHLFRCHDPGGDPRFAPSASESRLLYGSP